MPGEWIPWCKGLSRRREVQCIADATGKTRREVACLLMEFWEWADDETEDGRLPGLSVMSLSQLHNAAGATFFNAMCAVGWLTERSGELEIPNFARWMGRSGKKRLKARRRQQDYRNNRMSDAQNVTPLSQNGHAEPVTNNNNNKEDSAARKPARKTTRKQPEPRPRDLLFDAIAAVTGSDPKASGSHIGKVAAALRKADPPYSPDEVRQLPAAIAARGLSFTVTLGAVEKYIGWVRQTRALETETRAQRDARILRERAEHEEAMRQAQAERATFADHGKEKPDGTF